MPWISANFVKKKNSSGRFSKSGSPFGICRIWRLPHFGRRGLSGVIKHTSKNSGNRLWMNNLKQTIATLLSFGRSPWSHLSLMSRNRPVRCSAEGNGGYVYHWGLPLKAQLLIVIYRMRSAAHRTLISLIRNLNSTDTGLCWLLSAWFENVR